MCFIINFYKRVNTCIRDLKTLNRELELYQLKFWKRSNFTAFLEFYAYLWHYRNNCYRGKDAKITADSRRISSSKNKLIIFKGKKNWKSAREDEQIVVKIHCFGTINCHTCANFLRKRRRVGIAGANRISRVAH